MRISTVIARAYLYLTALSIGIIALCGLLQFGLPPSVLKLPAALQGYAPLTYGLFLALGSSLLLYLKAPLASRSLALFLFACAALLLCLRFIPGLKATVITTWPSMPSLPPELNTEALGLLMLSTLVLMQHPAVFAKSISSFISAQVLSLGLLSTSLVLTSYTLLSPLQLISPPLGIAFCIVGHCLGLLSYRIFTHALVPPAATYQASHPPQTYAQSWLTESNIGVWELNMGTKALQLDRQTLELYGLDPANAPFSLDDWLNVVLAEDRAALSHTLEQTAQATAPSDCVFRITAKDHAIRHVRMRTQQLTTSAGSTNLLIGMSFDITDTMQQTLTLNQLNAALLQYAYYDSLTGLMNRHAFKDAAERALAEAKRRDFTLAGFFIDLDWFKAINDVHGHAMGDRVLVAVAKRIIRTLRAEDLVCRLGGDEFFALLGHIHSTAQAKHIAEQLIKDIQRPIRVDGLTLQVGASIGIACYPEDAATIAVLMERADETMRHAKLLGKGRCAYYNE